MIANKTCHKEENIMNKEDVLRKSREENRNGDEFVKLRAEKASYNGYCAAVFMIGALAICCYFGSIEGKIIINHSEFDLANVLWGVLFIANLIEYASRYVYFKKKKYLYYSIFWLCGLIFSILTMFGFKGLLV